MRFRNVQRLLLLSIAWLSITSFLLLPHVVKEPENPSPTSFACEALPGRGAEVNLYGLHSIQSIGHASRSIKLSENAPEILCILDFESPSKSNRFLGPYCDGILMRSNKKNQQSPEHFRDTPATVHTIPEQATSTEMLSTALNLTTYDWFYFAAPDRFFLGPHAKFRLQLALQGNLKKEAQLQTNEAAYLESFVVDDVSAVRFQGGRIRRTISNPGGCRQSNLWNRQALAQWTEGHANQSLYERVQKAPPVSARCVRGVQKFKQERWQQYTEVVTNSMERFGALLDGSCESTWKPRIPHAIALDKQGKQFVPDVTYVRRHPLPFSKSNVCDLPLGKGVEGKDGSKGLAKIQIAAPDSSKKVLCMIYTHSGQHEQLRSVVETWGPLCDGFFAASNVTEASLGAVNLLHEGPEAYQNMWLKVQAMFLFAHRHYLKDYDYFHIGGDDHYVIPANLRYTARTGNWKGPWNQSAPMFLGGPIADKLSTTRYCGGGSGYTLNRAALDLFAKELIHHPDCWPHWQASDEDRIMSSCFRTVGLQCMDTNDQVKESRYHPWGVDYHAGWTKTKLGNWGPVTLEEDQNIPQPEMLGQISVHSVSFHLKPLDGAAKENLPTDLGMRRYHSILYNLCNGHFG